MNHTPHVDDAFSFLVTWLKTNPDWPRHHYGYEVWLPDIVGQFLRGQGRQVFGEEQHDPKLDDLWRAFYDAAWRLCRMGALRPSLVLPRAGATSAVSPGTGFSITVPGRQWHDPRGSRLFPQ